MDNAYSGGHYNSVYSIPEFKAYHYLNITQGYLVDKKGNKFLYAVYDPTADTSYGKGRFVLLEEYNQ